VLILARALFLSPPAEKAPFLHFPVEREELDLIPARHDFQKLLAEALEDERHCYLLKLRQTLLFVHTVS